MREEVKEIIDLFDLHKKTPKSGSKFSRKWEHLYPRQYLIYYLRKKGVTLELIGEMVGVNYSTVIATMKRVNNFHDTNDKIFQDYTAEIREHLENNPIDTRKPIVKAINMVFECRDMDDLEELKTYINKNVKQSEL